MSAPVVAFLETVTAFGVLVKDASGAVVACNPAAQRLFARERSALVGRAVDELVRGQTALRGDGTAFTAEVVYEPLAEGGLTALFVTDVTERRRLAAQKDEAVALASHELRAPITSIGMAVSLLAHGTLEGVPENVKRLLQIADRECSRLRRLVDDYLSAAKMESGGVPFNPRRVELAPVVRQAVDSARALGDAVGVRFVLEDAAPGAIANIDPDRAVQAVLNLLSNSVKFAPTGSDVGVGVARAGGFLRVSVRDRGPGVPEAFREKLFKKFAQASSDPEEVKRKGSGLGLSIVQTIAERLGGRAGYEPAAGGGSVFFIEFPSA